MVLQSGQQEPPRFSSARRSDDSGREYWSARALLIGPGGYPRWEATKRLWDRLMVVARANDVREDEIFFVPSSTDADNKPVVGRPGQDELLTLYGCYLVCRCADPTKPEVAASLEYFTTRLAETGREPIAILDDADARLQTTRAIHTIGAMLEQHARHLVHLDHEVEALRDDGRDGFARIRDVGLRLRDRQDGQAVAIEQLHKEVRSLQRAVATRHRASSHATVTGNGPHKPSSTIAFRLAVSEHVKLVRFVQPPVHPHTYPQTYVYLYGLLRDEHGYDVWADGGRGSKLSRIEKAGYLPALMAIAKRVLRSDGDEVVLPGASGEVV